MNKETPFFKRVKPSFNNTYYSPNTPPPLNKAETWGCKWATCLQTF